MKELELMAIKLLIPFYEKYLSIKNIEDLQEIAGLLNRLADLWQEYAEVCEQQALEVYSQLPILKQPCLFVLTCCCFLVKYIDTNLKI